MNFFSNGVSFTVQGRNLRVYNEGEFSSFLAVSKQDSNI